MYDLCILHVFAMTVMDEFSPFFQFSDPPPKKIKRVKVLSDSD